MPEETVVAPTAPETEPSEISISDYRKARSEGKELPETPAAATEAKPEPAKTAPVTEAGSEQEEEVEGTDKDGKPAKVKVKGGFQRKIDKLTREVGDKDRIISDLQVRLETLEQKKPEVQQTAKIEGDPKPDKNDPKYKGKDYEDFAVDLARWVTRQELKESQERQSKTAQELGELRSKIQSKQIFDKYLGELRSVKDTKPDYDAVFADVQFPDYIHNQLIGMEKGAEIAYELAKNKEVLRKILDLNAEGLRRGDGNFSDAYWEFGAFVRSLNKTTPAPKIEKPVSQAPAPITPVGGTAGPTEIDPDKIESVSEYRKLRASGRIR